MFRWGVLVCGLFVWAASDDTLTENTWNTPQQILADGFPAETHTVTTIDGYILELHRIPHGRVSDDVLNRPVVFVMHGLSAHSGYFTHLGPDYSFAYNLADAGFDVWMGNARGNTYSRKHVYLDPDNSADKFQFFDFSFEEIAIYDLPAMLEYVLEVTGRQRLHYIGHSQGSTVFMILAALHPHFMSKIISAHLMAPVGYQEYFPDEDLANTAARVDTLYSIALLMGIVEVFPDVTDGLLPNVSEEEYRRSDYCTGDVQQKYLCDMFGFQYLVRDSGPSLSSVAIKQYVHFGQNIRDKQFRRFHFGTNNNLVVYGLEEPPLYDISLVSIDVTLHYTVSDAVLNERDVLTMAGVMPNAKVRKVARESFLHEDFIAALDAKELVTDYIIEQIRNTPFDEDVDDTTIDNSVNVVDQTDDDQTNDDQTDDEQTDDSTNDVDTTPIPDADAIDLTTPAADSAISTLINVYIMFLVPLFIMF